MCVALTSSDDIPSICLHIVFRNICAALIHDAETVLRFGMPLLSGHTEPACRFRIVFRNSLALSIHGAEEVLRFDVSLFGSLPVPVRSFNSVSDIIGIHKAQIILRVSTSLDGFNVSVRADSDHLPIVWVHLLHNVR